MKALHVLPYKVEEIELPDDADQRFDAINRVLGCDFTDCAGYIGTDHITYVDQEAAFKANPTLPVHAVSWISQPLLGDILVMGVHMDGTCGDVTMTAEELEEHILITCTQDGDVTRPLKELYHHQK